ncbi:MAG: universal stress protein [Alteromonadaceae bacterium]|nr:MAG: universal stress protein [Alteromonadaceae bacterium]
MSNPEKLFVVVDPSDHIHVALERALMTSKLRKNETILKVFVGVDNESSDMRASNDALCRSQAWFEDVIRIPCEASGIEYSIEVSWASEWQQAILNSASYFGADRIYLPLHERSGLSRFTFSESKWGILKNAQCPVVLIQPDAPKQRKVVLAAVNFQAIENIQKTLNTSILDWGKTVKDLYDAEFHVVNAYKDSMNYPDRGQLATQTGLPADRIHVEQGFTGDAVSKVAKELQADLVVLGSLGQNGMIKSRRGNTAARVIAALSQDIMIVNC